MRNIVAIASVLTTCSCNVPAMRFLDAQLVETVVNERTYKIFFTHSEAEVIRAGFTSPRDFHLIHPEMEIAVRRATDCEPVSMEPGADPIRAVFNLSCSKT